MILPPITTEKTYQILCCIVVGLGAIYMGGLIYDQFRMRKQAKEWNRNFSLIEKEEK